MVEKSHTPLSPSFNFSSPHAIFNLSLFSSSRESEISVYKGMISGRDFQPYNPLLFFPLPFLESPPFLKGVVTGLL